MTTRIKPRARANHIVRSHNYVFMMNTLAKLNQEDRPWVYINLDAESNLITYQLCSEENFPKLSSGWERKQYVLIEQLLYEVFRELIRKNAVRGIQFEGVEKAGTPLRRFGFFMTHRDYVTLRYDFTIRGQVIAMLDWELPSNSEEWIAGEHGSIYVVEHANGAQGTDIGELITGG